MALDRPKQPRIAFVVGATVFWDRWEETKVVQVSEEALGDYRSDCILYTRRTICVSRLLFPLIVMDLSESIY
jgi:hypothetical protein